MDLATIESAVNFFAPYLNEGSFINFYGGEPLLAFRGIQHAVDLIGNGLHRQDVNFTISTNGSLLDDEKLEFFRRHRFSILLSFDGSAQDTSRQEGSSKQIIAVIDRILACPDIELEVHSVFTPATIGYLSESAMFLTELGVPEFSVGLSQTHMWDPTALLHYQKELRALKTPMLAFYLRHGYIPFTSFRRSRARGVFSCYAGRDRMTITPVGKIWGCHLFADFFQGKESSNEYSKYCFGDLECFMRDWETVYPEIASNYSGLRQDHFLTDKDLCDDCEDIKECRVCPFDNRVHGSSLVKVPIWVCEQSKILKDVKGEFWKGLIPKLSKLKISSLID